MDIDLFWVVGAILLYCANDNFGKMMGAFLGIIWLISLFF